MKPWIMKKRIIKAWFKKKLGIASPSSYFMGYKYEYDRLKSWRNKEDEEVEE